MSRLNGHYSLLGVCWGILSKGYIYAGSNTLVDVGWVRDNANNLTHEVGLKKANELGIYDMTGNVWEFCSDWFDDNYYKNSPSNNPVGPTTGTHRVLRGGSWHYDDSGNRLAYRFLSPPNESRYYTGFRVALVP